MGGRRSLAAGAVGGIGLIAAGAVLREEAPACVQTVGFECPAPDNSLSIALTLIGGLTLAGVLLILCFRSWTTSREDRRGLMAEPRPRPERPPLSLPPIGPLLQWIVRGSVLAFMLILGWLAFLFDGYQEDGGSEPANGLPLGIIMFAAAGVLVIGMLRERLGAAWAALLGLVTAAILTGIAVATLEWTRA